MPITKENLSAQGLLDIESQRHEERDRLNSEKELALQNWRKGLADKISEHPVYVGIKEVMEDEPLGQLVSLFWKVWQPIELVRENQTQTKQIKIGKLSLGELKYPTKATVTKHIVFPGLTKTMPLDPAEFTRSYPVDYTIPLSLNQKQDPIEAYLESVCPESMEEIIRKRIPEDIQTSEHKVLGLVSFDLNDLERSRAFGNMNNLRRYCPSYGKGNCGIIKLEAPAYHVGKKNFIVIKVGYDFKEKGIRIDCAIEGNINLHKSFFTLRGLQEELAGLLVRNGVSKVSE